MPPPELSYRRQKAVLWEAYGPREGSKRYDRYGQVKVIAPVEIEVRWITKQSEALDPQGNTITLDATVVSAQKIPIGSTMWLGELSDWYGTGSGGDDSEVMQVKTSDITVDLKGRVTRYEAGLMRYRDTLPDTAP